MADTSRRAGRRDAPSNANTSWLANTSRSTVAATPQLGGPAQSAAQTLVDACFTGDVGHVQQILDDPRGNAKAIINGDDSTSNTPLVMACLHGHLRVAQLLLQRGADPSVAGPEHNPVCAAVLAAEAPGVKPGTATGLLRALIRG